MSEGFISNAGVVDPVQHQPTSTPTGQGAGVSKAVGLLCNMLQGMVPCHPTSLCSVAEYEEEYTNVLKLVTISPCSLSTPPSSPVWFARGSKNDSYHPNGFRSVCWCPVRVMYKMH
jgi:hypothetical protein